MKKTHYILLSALAVNLCLSKEISKDSIYQLDVRNRRDLVSKFITSKFIDFVEEKLMQHSNALDYIFKAVKKLEGLLKNFQEKYDLGTVASKLFGKRETDRCYLEYNQRTEWPNEINNLIAKRNRRDISSSLVNNKFVEFVEDKLLQHSTALEFISTSVHKIEALLNKLLENDKLGSGETEIFDNDESEQRPSRRRIQTNQATETVNPIVAAFKPLFQYGNIARRLIENELYTEADPLPIIEYDEMHEEDEKRHDESIKLIKHTRRFSNITPAQPSSNQNIKPLSPWCRPAAYCRGNRVKACGYDEKYGFAYFEDVCHMMKHNCESNSNFMITSCAMPGNVGAARP